MTRPQPLLFHNGANYHGTHMTPTLIALSILSITLTVIATVLVRCRGIVLTPTQQTITRRSLKCALVGSCIVVGLARFLDLAEIGHQNPHIPALATAASWAAALAMIPVPKAMNPGRLLLGVGYERAIPLHTFVGTFVAIAGGMHGSSYVLSTMMADSAGGVDWASAPVLSAVAQGERALPYDEAPSVWIWAVTWWSNFLKSNLAGALTSTSFILLALSSREFVRRYAFATWRAMHILFVSSGYFFLAIHDPKTITLLLPMAAYYAADMGLRITTSILGGGRVQEVIAHSDARVVEVRIKLHGFFPEMLFPIDKTIDDAVTKYENGRMSDKKHDDNDANGADGHDELVDIAVGGPARRSGGLEKRQTSSKTSRSQSQTQSRSQSQNQSQSPRGRSNRTPHRLSGSIRQRFLQTIGRVLFPPLAPGDFIHFGILCRKYPRTWPAHPYTVARYDNEARTATFFVKALGPWSNSLLATAHSDPESLVGSRVTWFGPCGSLQVPLDSVPNHLLVCGGVGVTPMITILQALAAQKTRRIRQSGEVATSDTVSNELERDSANVNASDAQESTGLVPAKKKGHDVFVWSVRGLALAEALWPTIAPLAAAAAVKVRIFDTSAAARDPNTPVFTAAATAASSTSAALTSDHRSYGAMDKHDDESLTSWTSRSCHLVKLEEVVEGGRPNIARVLADEFGSGHHGGGGRRQNLHDLSVDDDATLTSSVATVGLYCCGPDGLSEHCFSAASARPSTFFHKEEF